MATPLLGLYAPADGSDAGAWGHNFVNGLSTTLDNIIASFQTVAVNGLTPVGGGNTASVTLSAAQCGAQMLRITGNVTYNVSITGGGGNPLWNGVRCIENLATQTGGPFNINLIQASSIFTIPFNTRVLLFLDLNGGTRLMAITNVNGTPDIPTGTVASFYQSSAPTGWTISSSLNDFGLRVVSAGGGVTSGGSQPYSTVFKGPLNTGNYTLLLADFPSHNHTITGEWLGNNHQGFTSGFFAGGGFTASTDQDFNEPPTGSTGGGGPHNHLMALNVRTADFILATKN